jgi:hemolysin activation/secretion protein
VFEFAVEGNSVLDDEAIERAVYPFLGSAKSVDDIEAARAALERAYHDAGYLTVAVELPEQQIDADRVVKLVVQEGRVERLKISGAEHFLPSRVREGVPSLAAGSVPQFSAVQDELTALGRQTSDRQVTPLLRPGKAPGKIEVELKVDDKSPIHGSVELNNKQSYSTEQGRLESSVRHDNLFQRGHSLGVNWIYSPHAPDQANIWVFSYGIPLRGGDYLSASVVSSDSNIPAEIGGATVVNGESVGLRYRKNLPSRSYNLYHGLTVGIDYKANRDALDRDFQTLVPRALHYWTLAGRYDVVIPDDDGRSQTSLDLNLTAGLPPLTERRVGCDGFPADQFACKRAGAEAGFATLRLGGARIQSLPANWTLDVKGELQIASGPLVPQEQFGAGGRDSVRGYYEYERFGDSGASATVELQTPPLLTLSGVQLKALAFYDWAQLRVSDPLPLEEARIDLASYGLGVRAQGRGIVARLDIAVPLHTSGTQGVDGNGDPLLRVRTRKNDARVHLGIGYQF